MPTSYDDGRMLKTVAVLESALSCNFGGIEMEAPLREVRVGRSRKYDVCGVEVLT